MNEIKKLARDMNCLKNYSDTRVMNPNIKLFGFIIKQPIKEYLFTKSNFMIYHSSGMGSVCFCNTKKEVINFIDKWFKTFVPD